MAKLSDYSPEEIKAVEEYFTEDWLPGFKERITDKDRLSFMNSFVGARIVLNMRLRKLGRDIIESFKVTKR